jgi:hypothetical protein
MLKNPLHAFTLYELEQRIAAKPVSIRRHIADLKKLGWVEETPFSPRKFKVNLSNSTVKHLSHTFEVIGYI